MNSDRFAALAAAFGGKIARWPRSERMAARWFAFRSPIRSNEVLAQAGQLDRLLSQSPTPMVSVELTRRIMDAALIGLPRSRRNRRWTPVWIGAGLVAACAGGAVTALVISPEPASAIQQAVITDPAEDAATALREPSDPGEV